MSISNVKFFGFDVKCEIPADLAVGFWKDLDDIRSNWAIDRSFYPEIEAAVREERISGWHKAVECTKGWSR